MIGTQQPPTDKPKLIFRAVHDKDNPYVVVNARPFRGKYLSFKARGILAYILACPDTWEVNIPDLVAHSPKEGAASIRAGLRELRTAGHAHYRPHREAGRIVRWTIEVHEVPFLEAAAQDDQQADQLLDDDFLQVEKLHEGNRSQLSNEGELSIDSEVEPLTLQQRVDLMRKLYQDNIGLPSGLISDLLRNAAIEFPSSWFLPAFEVAVSRNKRSWAYIETVLRNWKSHGFGWSPMEQYYEKSKSPRKGQTDAKANPKGTTAATTPTPDALAIARRRAQRKA